MSSAFGRSLDYSKLLGQVALSKITPSGSLKKASEKALAQKLLELRGAPTKISQILSMKGEDSQQYLRRKALQEIPPISLNEISFYLSEYAESLNSKIESISSEAQAASLGQVHKIKLKGEEKAFALKIQYPDAKEILSVDQGLFKLITKTFDSFKEGFSLKDYHDFIKTELLKELDYSQELLTQEKFREYFSKDPHIIIPKVHPQLSSPQHLFMDFEEALGVDEFLNLANEKQVKEARKLIVTFYLESLFLLGTIHCDPNPGNINFRINSHGQTELVVYDFGSTHDLSLKERLAILKLIEQSKQTKPELLPYFKELNFDCEALHSLGDKLSAFCELIFEPFNSQIKYDLKKWRRSEKSKIILGDQRFVFMTAAPSSFLPCMRFFQGLFFYLDKLGSEAFLQGILKKVDSQIQVHLDHYQAPKIDLDESYQNALNLCISVTENGKEKISLKLPRKAVENLDDFIDSELREKIERQKISIPQIIHRARESAYAPQDLLELKSESKNIFISLK